MRGALVVAVGLIVAGLAGCGTQPDPAPTQPTEATPTASATARPEPSLGVTDSGARKGAMGEVTTDADGVPLTYTVVEGDTPDEIRMRFDIWWDQLVGPDGERLNSPLIYPGDVLTFTGSREARETEHP